ncbi:hypothetical protein [Melittangium boletus]|uniref:Uncharacterized protein n=1 Tax=Melittangium boletus DSM 14713 TaxID=1294270 RepID=A0A250IPT0_9BACT|nr:hypothetical protein [Melittangium boletus]ATB33253.1 hypothetical protein MEBOL_006744 [Melittangium boletus DSM 14713]
MKYVPTLVAVLGVLFPSAPSARESHDTASPPLVKRLRVTEGDLEPLPGGRLRIEAPKVRAVDRAEGTPRASRPGEELRVAELRFTYQGPTPRQQALRSGEMRRQVGLKLRARDGCNVVYVMWRLAPTPGLVVSVKSNPALSRSADCGNHGYKTVKPRTREPVPDIHPGAPHTLRAELQGALLRVRVDGTRVWEGALPPEAFAFDGPVGLRSDNGRFEVELRSTP